MTRFAPALALFAICALATASCSTNTNSSQGSPGPGASPSPASSGCAAMDTILADALASSETGKAFSAFEAQGTSEAHPQERQRVWLAFAQTLEHDYSDQLNNAATDAAAQTALVALDQYVHHSSALSSGEISEFTNELDAEEALKRGERPETNPEYERALDEMIEAHRTLTACMPHWPVLF